MLLLSGGMIFYLKLQPDDASSALNRVSTGGSMQINCDAWALFRTSSSTAVNGSRLKDFSEKDIVSFVNVTLFVMLGFVFRTEYV